MYCNLGLLTMLGVEEDLVKLFEVAVGEMIFARGDEGLGGLKAVIVVIAAAVAISLIAVFFYLS